MPDLLLELRSEEIPARMQRKAAGDLKKMVTDGEWQKIVDANLGPAGYKPGAGNPPTPDACA